LALNTAGVAYHLTAISPVRPEHRRTLTSRLAGLAAEDPSPFARLPATHYVRLVPFDHLGAIGRGERMEPLHARYLLTSLIFDGDPNRYLVELAGVCRRQVEDVWGSCEGCPGPDDGVAFASWLRHDELDALHSFATIPAATARRIRSALSLRQRLIHFAVASQNSTAEDLHRAYRSEFTDH
jgi:hypothetical protein